MRRHRGAAAALAVLIVLLMGAPARADSIEYFTEVRNDEVHAVANHNECSVVTDTGDMIYDLLIDQDLHDLINDTVDSGGHIYVYTTTHGAASTPQGSSSGSYEVRLRLSIIHAAGGKHNLRRALETMTAPPSFSVNTPYSTELRSRAIGLIEPNDVLRVRALGFGEANPGNCGGVDNPIVEWDFGNAGEPYLYIDT